MIVDVVVVIILYCYLQFTEIIPPYKLKSNCGSLVFIVNTDKFSVKFKTKKNQKLLKRERKLLCKILTHTYIYTRISTCVHSSQHVRS